jgi:hypothetical protein
MDRLVVESEERGFIIHRAVWMLGKIDVPVVLGLSLVLLLAIGTIDFLTGVRLTVAPFYLVPVGIVALRANKVITVSVSILAGVIWMFLDFLNPGELTLLEDFWNILMRSGVFLLFALVLNRIKGDHLRETKLRQDLQAAMLEVKQLSGLLPICAWCKRIRDDDDGEWESIETYITDHSGADFTHGICPDCAKRVHPAMQQKK